MNMSGILFCNISDRLQTAAELFDLTRKSRFDINLGPFFVYVYGNETRFFFIARFDSMNLFCMYSLEKTTGRSF